MIDTIITFINTYNSTHLLPFHIALTLGFFLFIVTPALTVWLCMEVDKKDKAEAAAKAKVEVQVVEFNAADHAEKYVNDHWCETFESALRVANEAIADGATDVAVAPCEGLYVVMVNY